MELILEVNEVTPGSYSKGDKTYQTLELLCTDKSEGKRLKHAVVFAVRQDQQERVKAVNLRDKRISVDVDEITPGFGGGIRFRGSVIEGTLPPVNGPLKVEKPKV